MFGLLLLLFGVGMLIAGLGTGLTTVDLPPEHHPSLLFERKDVQPMRERLARSPYSEWRRRLLKQLSVDNDKPFEEASCSENAHRAKALAFAFALTGDREYAARATTILKKAQPPARCADWRGLDEIVEGATAYAIAYDLLAGYLRSQAVLEQKTRLLVYELGNELYRSRYIWPSPCGDTRDIRQYSALGLCALAVSDFTPRHRDEHSPRKWHSRAKQRVLSALSAQVCSDGAYAEGPGAHFEAANLYIPFFLANQRVTGENLLDDAALKACEWAIRIRMPNGMRPNVDSSALTPACSYALTTRVPKAALFRWDAAQASVTEAVPDDQLPEALAWYNDEGLVTPPTWPPSHTLTGSGDVVFRSGWQADDTYMFLRAERAKARTAGGTFEQPDATSLVVCRGDETLVLDSGYGGWHSRDETRGAASHNMVLIDGKGPPMATALGAVLAVGVDVETVDEVFDEQVDAVRVRAEHSGAVFERTVIFADKRNFIIFDDARASRGEHDFTWLLHVNAEGTTDGTLSVEGNTACVTRPKAKMALAVYSPGRDALKLRTSAHPHYMQAGREEHHAVLRTTAYDCSHAQFISVLSPVDSHEAFPVVAAQDTDGGVAATVGDNGHAFFRKDGDARIGSEVVSTDGFAIYWSETASGTPDYVLVMGARNLWIGSAAVWHSSKPASAVWRPTRPKASTKVAFSG